MAQKLPPASTEKLDAADEIVRSLRKILRKVNEHSRHVAREGDVSISGLLCLRQISHSPAGQPITSVDIARATQLSMPTVSRILDRLEKDGLIARNRSPVDRRKLLLKLTPKGKRKVLRLPQPLHEGFLDNLHKTSKRRQREILAVLHQVVEMMGATDLDAAPILSPEIVSKDRRHGR